MKTPLSYLSLSAAFAATVSALVLPRTTMSPFFNIAPKINNETTLAYYSSTAGTSILSAQSAVTSMWNLTAPYTGVLISSGPTSSGLIHDPTHPDHILYLAATKSVPPYVLYSGPYSLVATGQLGPVGSEVLFDRFTIEFGGQLGYGGFYNGVWSSCEVVAGSRVYSIFWGDVQKEGEGGLCQVPATPFNMTVRQVS